MGCLTCCALFHRESDFGFKDRLTDNVNVKVKLYEKYMFVDVNGIHEMKHNVNDDTLSREGLAGKPIKLITKCGRHLSVSFDLETDQLTLKHNGEDVEKLPKVEKVLQIYRNKVKHSQTSDQRYVTLILILFLPRLLIIWRVLFTE